MKASSLPNLKGLVSNNNRLKIELTKAINAGATYAKRGAGYSAASIAIKTLLDAAITANREFTRADSISAGADAPVAVAATHQLVVTATFPDAGTAVVSDARVTYSSATPAVATVDAYGLVTGVSAGTSVITVTFQGRTDTVTITVS